MNPYSSNEIAVGAFVSLGLVGLAYLSVSIGGLEWGLDRMPIHARFASIGDLKTGASVKIAGVKVGTVDGIRLENYAAEVDLAVDRAVVLPADSTASIRTEGLLGESYILLTPGGAEDDIPTDGRIGQTEPALDLIDLLVKYALSSDEATGEGDAEDALPDPFE
ncbi:MAG: outer membrane lipid asymmetry maintenance protein MlaD [Myxococcota bacterium]